MEMMMLLIKVYEYQRRISHKYFAGVVLGLGGILALVVEFAELV